MSDHIPIVPEDPPHPQCAWQELCKDLPPLYAQMDQFTMSQQRFGARLATLEARLNMLSNNIAQFTGEHRKLHAELAHLMREQAAQTQEVHQAMRNVLGTDFAKLSAEFAGSKKLTARWVHWLEGKGRALMAIAGGVAAVIALFQCTPGKSQEPAPMPPSAPAPAPAPRGDL